MKFILPDPRASWSGFRALNAEADSEGRIKARPNRLRAAQPANIRKLVLASPKLIANAPTAKNAKPTATIMWPGILSESLPVKGSAATNNSPAGINSIPARVAV